MNHRTGRVLVVLATISLLWGVACSDQDDPASTANSKERPSEEGFVAEVEPVCADLDETLVDFVGPTTFPAELDDFGTNSERFVGMVEGDVSLLSELTPPQGWDARWNRFVEQLQLSVEKAELIVELVAAKNDDTDALASTWTASKTARAQAMELADEMGLESCDSLVAEGGGH